MKKKRCEPQVEIIRAADVLPGMEYPYLPREWEWEIRNIPFSLLDEEKDRPTLRLVKDDKVIDIHIPGMDTATFLAYWGLKSEGARGRNGAPGKLCRKTTRAVANSLRG